MANAAPANCGSPAWLEGCKKVFEDLARIDGPSMWREWCQKTFGGMIATLVPWEWRYWCIHVFGEEVSVDELPRPPMPENYEKLLEIVRVWSLHVLNPEWPPKPSFDFPGLWNGDLPRKQKQALEKLCRVLAKYLNAEYRLPYPAQPGDEKFLALIEEAKEAIGAYPPVGGKKSRRHPDQPGKPRQEDIISTILVANLPLTRPELIEHMRLKKEGKLGHHLAWMVKQGLLTNIPNLGYWLSDRPVPE